MIVFAPTASCQTQSVFLIACLLAASNRRQANASTHTSAATDGRNPGSVNSASKIAVSCLSYSDLAAWLKSLNDIPPRFKTVCVHLLKNINND